MYVCPRYLGLTAPQYAVLSAVEAEPGLSTRLARAAVVTPQSMQGILANLERDGLLVRHPDPDHGRVLQQSEITPTGRKILTDAHNAVQRVENRMIAVFGPKAADKVAEQLSRCAGALSETSRSDYVWHDSDRLFPRHT
jgi:DNA-binding MarR family transcriptional regulator